MKQPTRGGTMTGVMIRVQGPQHSGKTEIIGLAWEMLLRHRERGARRIPRGRGRRELIGRILALRPRGSTTEEVLVGFMSKSEPVTSETNPERTLTAVLNELDEAGCRVIVCATHEAGTRSAITAFDFARKRRWRVVRIETCRNAYNDEERAREIETEVLNAVDSIREPVGV